MSPIRSLSLVAVLVLGLVGPRSCLAAESAQPVVLPSAHDLMARVRPGHPRLLATAHDFEVLRHHVQEWPLLAAWHRRLVARAERVLEQPPSRYEIPDGLRLLSVSRRVLSRVYLLALLYQLDGNPRYAQRAWRELDAAAHFKDWNPRHFLDTAEMTHAFAIGYDWLYHAWTPAQRDVLRRAIVEKGLRLGVESYRSSPSYGWWTKAKHNWNQVCNGGIGMGALAVADVEPALAGEFLEHALHSIQLPMRQFAPDGAWAEGPGYWNYATKYNVIFLAALNSALGSDFGLSKMPGFSLTGLFPLYVTGPLNLTFNYSDGGDHAVRAPQLFWLARRFQEPACAQYEEQHAVPQPLDLLWFDPQLVARREPLALDNYFRHAEVVTFRSAWNDPHALYLGFKGGDNRANHSHLDLGTFVLDALGVRWALDLGADNYNLPGYFGRQRWTYYRLRAEGHNTLLIDPGAGPDQSPRAAAKIIRFESSPRLARATADLTAAYPAATEVHRTVALVQRRRVLVVDEIKTRSPADVWWFLHTATQITVSPSGRTATLRHGQQRLMAELLSPTSARFTVRAAEPLPSSPHPGEQAVNRGVRKLAIHLTDVQHVRLAVRLTPLQPGASVQVPAAADLQRLGW